MGPQSPHPQTSVASPTLWVQGGDTLAGGVGDGKDPIPTKGQTLWYSMYTIL